MKVFLDSIGCRLNQSEIERYARQFRSAGHTLVAELAEAELMVLNTCAVTASAAADSRKRIRSAQRAGVGEIVVTGCWSELATEQAAGMRGVSQVVPNEKKDRLVSELLQIDLGDFEAEPGQRSPIPGARHKTRAYIKAQDGCDNRCTFCVTTLARGAGRSRPVGEVLAEVQAALAGGAQEVVLTGVHLGSWGQDIEPALHLRQLVEAVLDIEDLPRLRLSSLEPWDLDENFFGLWVDPRLCRHLHLPLQSGSGATLRRMARNTTPNKFAGLVEAARRQIPGVAISTDIIVGFPGESEAEFQESLDFVRAMEFADAHVFTYSERPGTAAASMPDQVHNAIRKARSAAMRAVMVECAAAYRRRFVGNQVQVLWEAAEELDGQAWQLSGLTDNYLRVEAAAGQPLWNQITPVKLTAVTAQGLRGSLLPQPAVWFAN